MRSTSTRLLVTALIVSLVTAFGGTPAAACSCARPEPSDALEQSDAVFIGEITEIRRPGSLAFNQQEARYIFSVETVFKGDVYEQQSIVTHAQGSACGLEISGPGRFLMFATIDGFGGPTPEAGEFASGLCNANTSERLENSVAGFGDGYTPLAGASPTGTAGLTVVAWGALFAGGLLLVLIGSLMFVGIQRRATKHT
jgi:hypothetical protein